MYKVAVKIHIAERIKSMILKLWLLCVFVVIITAILIAIGRKNDKLSDDNLFCFLTGVAIVFSSLTIIITLIFTSVWFVFFW